jgi:hypothetical protein
LQPACPRTPGEIKIDLRRGQRPPRICHGSLDPRHYRCHHLGEKGRTASSGGRAEHCPSSLLLGRSAVGRRHHLLPLSAPFYASSGRPVVSEQRRRLGASHPIEIRHRDPLPSSVSIIDRRGDKVAKGEKSLGAPQDCTIGLPSAAVFFLKFFPFRYQVCMPCHLSPFIVDTPEGQGCCCSLQATTTTLMVKPSIGVVAFSCGSTTRRRSSSSRQCFNPPLHLQPFSHGHRRQCFCRKTSLPPLI